MIYFSNLMALVTIYSSYDAGLIAGFWKHAIGDNMQARYWHTEPRVNP